ncbi:hypothetical protein ACFS07_19705 [Undibacterium arcticum]
MKHLWTYLFVGILLTVPLWLHDQYFLHILITTGIFIIGAMSLNLLLGFTGQLSLGHIAFFGIGAYTSALTSLGFDIPIFGDFRIVHQPWHPVAGILLGTLVAGLFGYIVGKLSFKNPGRVFRYRHHQFCGSRSPGGTQLGRSDARSARTQQHPADRIQPAFNRGDGLLAKRRRTTIWCWGWLSSPMYSYNASCAPAWGAR